MNLYRVEPLVGDDVGYEWHVAAETRGKARAIFVSYYEFGYFEFTDPLSIKLLAKDVDMPSGVDEQFEWARAQGYPVEFFPEGF